MRDLTFRPEKSKTNLLLVVSVKNLLQLYIISRKKKGLNTRSYHKGTAVLNYVLGPEYTDTGLYLRHITSFGAIGGREKRVIFILSGRHSSRRGDIQAQGGSGGERGWGGGGGGELNLVNFWLAGRVS